MNRSLRIDNIVVSSNHTVMNQTFDAARPDVNMSVTAAALITPTPSTAEAEMF